MATKWGVVSAGKISHDFVTAVQSIPEKDQHKFVAVAARTLESAETFASNHDIPKAYGSYEELAKNDDVEVVYIGAINSSHFEVGRLMLENGKHCLIEKPMTLNSKQTKTLIDLAREKNLFLMEAVWSRFFPLYKHVMETIKNGVIGDVVHVNANFGFSLMDVERLMRRDIGGGTILDLGIYTINAVTMAYGGDTPQKIAAVGHLNQDGVDIAMTSSLLYSHNRTASISTNAMAVMSNECVITGTKGSIKFANPFWCPTRVYINGKEQDFPLPDTVRECNFTNSSGLRFEAMEVRECLKKGATESHIMPLKDSETMAAIMDEIRHQIGVVYSVD